MFRSIMDKLRASLTRKSLVGFGVLALVLMAPMATHAALGFDFTGLFQSIVSTFVGWIVSFLGFILILLVKALIWAAEYSNFVAPGPTAVRIGWIVTRDLANMFFIVLLLISALSTIIGYKKYHYEAVLPRLIITAILINFSKTIVGLFIDLSQVIMLTFVNGFSQAAGGNFLNAFQINKLQALSEHGAAGSVGLLLGLFLAVVMLLVAVAVVLVLTVHLIARIVKLWILTITAPIAFISAIIPGLEKDNGKWWGELTQLLVSGPKIAFFLWLALITAQQTGQSGGNIATVDGGTVSAAQLSELQSANDKYGIPTQAAQVDVILSMIIMVSILMLGLEQAQGAETILGFSKAVKGKVKGTLDSVGKGVWNNTGGRVIKEGKYLTGLGITTAGKKLGEKAGVFSDYVSSTKAGRVGRSVSSVMFASSARNRAANFRQQAVKARADGKMQEAEQLERKARQWETYAKVKGVGTNIAAAAAAPFTAGLSLAPGAIASVPGAIQGVGKGFVKEHDTEQNKAIEEAVKKMKTEDAVGITSGKKTAKNETELHAAFRKAGEDGKLDIDGIMNGRAVLADSSITKADPDTIQAFEKIAKEKYGVYFKDGKPSTEKLNEDLEKKKVEFGKLTEAGKKYVLETATNSIKEKLTTEATTSGNTDAAKLAKSIDKAIGKMMRDNRVPNEAVTPDMVKAQPAIAAYILEKTKRTPEAREEIMTGKLGDAISQAVRDAYAAVSKDATVPVDKKADAVAEAVLASQITPADINAMSADIKSAVAKRLDVSGLAKLIEAVPLESRAAVQESAQAAVAMFMAANPKRAKSVRDNPQYHDAGIVPNDAAVTAALAGLPDAIRTAAEAEKASMSKKKKGGDQQNPPPAPPPPVTPPTPNPAP